jgi:hypothetical protein
LKTFYQPQRMRLMQPEMSSIETKRLDDLYAEIEQLKAMPKYHHPDCNYWKWDWRYSWDVTDCNCESVAGESPIVGEVQ